MSSAPIFVTDVSIAKSKDFVIAAFSGPSGEFTPGKLQTGEVFRMVISLSTLRAFATALTTTCAEVDAALAVMGDTPTLTVDISSLEKLRRSN